jgi:hypothetical protein
VTYLIELVLATIGSWDILRRLLPTRVHPLLGKLMCVAIPYSLYRWASPAIVLPLCVPGVLLLLNNVISAERFIPWGELLADLMRLRRRKDLPAPTSGVGNRVPRI